MRNVDPAEAMRSPCRQRCPGRRHLLRPVSGASRTTARQVDWFDATPATARMSSSRRRWIAPTWTKPRNRCLSVAVLEVRIHSAPANSPSLSRFRLRSWKSPGFAPVWRRGQAIRSAETRKVQQHRAEKRQLIRNPQTGRPVSIKTLERAFATDHHKRTAD